MSESMADALFEALANGLWRGTVLTLAAALLLRAFKRTTAAERHAVWLAILTVIALAPLSEVAIRSLQLAAPAVSLAVVESSVAAPNWTSNAATVESAPPWQAVEVAAAPFLMLWLAAGAFFAVRLGRRCSLATKLKKDSIAPGMELAAALDVWQRGLAARRVGLTRVSSNLHSPAAVGWLQPAVLLPQIFEAEVCDGDLELLWRHEQAHLSRLDDWTQLLSECLFAVAWFHPAAYWVRGQLEKEREMACDEAVLAEGVAAHRYAGALGRWAERAAMGQLPAGVMGLGRSPALIIRRIEMLLSPSRSLRRNGGGWAFAGGLAIALGTSLLLAIGAPQLINAQAVKYPVDGGVEVAGNIAVPVLATELGVSIEPALMSQAPPPASPTLVGSPPALFSPSSAKPAPRPTAVPMSPVPPVPQGAPAEESEQQVLDVGGGIGKPRPRVVALAPVPQVVPVPPVPPAPPARSQEESEARERARTAAEQARDRAGALAEQELDRAKALAEQAQEQARAAHEGAKHLLEEMQPEMVEGYQHLIREYVRSVVGEALNSAQRTDVQERLKFAAKRIQEGQPEFERLAEEMRRIQVEMKPLEERMKALSEELRKRQAELERTRREFEVRNQ